MKNSIKYGVDPTDVLERYNGKNGTFIKKFLINDAFNLNRWRVTKEALKRDLRTFIGKPLVLTPDMDHPPVEQQNKHKVGTIVDVGYDELRNEAWEIVEITEKQVVQGIKSGRIKYGSPTIISPRGDIEYLARGTAAESEIFHRFRGLNDSLVAEPAYGPVDRIKAVCEGDGKKCMETLAEAKYDPNKTILERAAAINDSAISQIIISNFIAGELRRALKKRA